MNKSVECAAAIMCVLGVAGGGMAAENSSQAPLTVIGICHPIENRLESRLSAVNGVSPILSAFAYLRDIEHRKFDESVFNNAKMTLLQAPTHGELRLYEQTQTGRYFSADYTYTGPDQTTVVVEIGDYKVKVIYHFVLMQNVPGSNEEGTATDNKSICPNGYMWKISTTSDASGNFIVSSIDYLPPTTSAASRIKTESKGSASQLILPSRTLPAAH